MTDRGNDMKKEKKGGLRLRTKLIGLTALFTALILTVIWLLFVVFLDDFYRQAKSREIIKTAKTIETHISDGTEELSDLVAKLCIDTDANVLIRRIDKTRAESITFIRPRDILSNNAAVAAITERAALDGGESLYTFDGASGTIDKRGKSEDDNMLYAKVISSDEEKTVILISVQLTPVDATKTTITGMLITVSVVFILIAVVIGYFMASTLSSPLTKLTAQAKDIGTPAYRRLEGDPGCRETAELNDTLAKASAELLKVDDLRRELIANVSHDLRTPLTMISGYGEMMREGGHTGEGDIYGSHWIVVHGADRSADGSVIGFWIIDSSSTIDYLTAEDLSDIYYGHDGTTILDPSCIEVFGWKYRTLVTTGE